MTKTCISSQSRRPVCRATGCPPSRFRSKTSTQQPSSKYWKIPVADQLCYGLASDWERTSKSLSQVPTRRVCESLPACCRSPPRARCLTHGELLSIFPFLVTFLLSEQPTRCRLPLTPLPGSYSAPVLPLHPSLDHPCHPSHPSVAAGQRQSPRRWSGPVASSRAPRR